MSKLTAYLNRSSRIARDATAKGQSLYSTRRIDILADSSVARTVLQMQGAEKPSRAPLTLFALNTPDAIREYAIGCDADVGGTSTAHFEYDADPTRAPPGKPGAARFHGVMRLAVRPGYEQRIRGGYAGFRNKVRPRLPRRGLTHARTLTLVVRSSARRCLANSQTTCRTTVSSRCACAPRDIRARVALILSTSRRRAQRTTTCGSTASTLRATTAPGKTFLFVLSYYYLSRPTTDFCGP